MLSFGLGQQVCMGGDDLLLRSRGQSCCRRAMMTSPLLVFLLFILGGEGGVGRAGSQFAFTHGASDVVLICTHIVVRVFGDSPA